VFTHKWEAELTFLTQYVGPRWTMSPGEMRKQKAKMAEQTAREHAAIKKLLASRRKTG
jgi:hypothetical protein